MDISILLATYRRPDLLSKTLESLGRLETGPLSWEVIVADNAGDEATRALVQRFGGSLNARYLVETRRGKNNALNRAVREAKGKLFLFTDDDVIADRRWCVEMWEGAARWPDTAVFGGRIIPAFHSGRAPLSRKHPFFKFAYVHAEWKIEEGPYEASHVWGPNMAIRAELFRKGWKFNPNIGPNGKNYVMGSETELTVRLEKSGYRPVYLPKSLVHHQIRPEQLKARWLFQRSFRDGRQRAVCLGLPDVPLLFGVPRYMVRKLVENRIKHFIFFYDRERSIDFGIKYWNLRGMLYQYRQGLSGTQQPPAVPELSDRS